MFAEANEILAQNEAIYENAYFKAYVEENVGEGRFADYKGDPAKFEKRDANGRMDCGTLTAEQCKADRKARADERQTRRKADRKAKRKENAAATTCEGNAD